MPTSTTNELRAATLIVIAALALVACGGGATSTAPAGPGVTSGSTSTQAAGGTLPPVGGPATQQPGGGGTVDACSLLTDADIQAVTGYTVSRATGGPQAGVFASGCEWELVAPDEIVPPSIVLGIMTEGGKAYYDTYFRPFNGAEGNTPIPGLGDEAIDVGFSTVHVVTGDTFFNLQYLGQQELEVELARKLVANL